jgi:linoleoyl-CoA desaturase
MKQGNTVVINFERSTEFKKVLSERIDQYFSSKNISQAADIRMYRKTAAVLGWLVASYILLVFFAHGPISGILFATSLGLAAAGVGFNIPHDGGHRAYAKNRIVNRLAASAFDLLGASSYIWHWKHNVYHHGYTNLVGMDDDIDLGGLGRLAPGQKHRWMHRFQQFYLWFLYGFLPFKWHFIDDFRALVSGPHRQTKVSAPQGIGSGNPVRRQSSVLLSRIRPTAFLSQHLERAPLLCSVFRCSRCDAERGVSTCPLRGRSGLPGSRHE